MWTFLISRLMGTFLVLPTASLKVRGPLPLNLLK
jgi:hypothetical protein